MVMLLHINTSLALGICGICLFCVTKSVCEVYWAQQSTVTKMGTRIGRMGTPRRDGIAICCVLLCIDHLQRAVGLV